MQFSDFLKELAADGRVNVGAVADFSAAELAEAERILIQQERIWRIELPAEPPIFCNEAAIWAATQLYRACQCAVFRDLDEEQVATLLNHRWNGAHTPDVHYSVDLTFHYLPDLLRIAESAASHDPLVSFIRGWCKDWPISSVGIPGLGEVDIDTILHSPSLLQLYIDRIIARGDRERLSSEPIREAVKRALGLHTELTPQLQSILFSSQEPRL